jgi:type II secretory pathway component PulL
MPTREELEEEDRRVRQLRIAVGLALSVIGQTDMTLAQAQEMVAATRGMALRLFPEKELTFDLIYLPRFRRLLAERFGYHRPILSG